MKVSNISKSHILKNISVDFEEKGIVFVKGKSGAGKTTLFNILSGIDNEYTGYIEYAKNSSKNVEWYRRNCLGIIFQDYNLIDSLNVKENILLGCEVAGKKIDEKQYAEILSLLDITKLENRNIAFLSGGEKQRVAIARELLRNDGVIFADEPSGNLDEENTKLLFDYIKKISKDILFIIITHDIQIAEEYGDRIIEIQDGEIVSDTRVRNQEKLELSTNETEHANKWMFKYCLKSMKKRRKKYIGISIITMFAMIFLMIIMGLVNTTSDMNTSIESDYLENDKYVIWKQDMYIFNDILSEKDITDLKKINNIKEMNFFYERNVDVKYGEKMVNVAYETYQENNFIKDRFSVGEELNDNKVVVDEKLAYELFGDESAIDKNVDIKISGNHVITVKIAGVKNSTSSKDGELYISEALDKEIYQDEYNEDITIYNVDDDMNSIVVQGEVNSNCNILLGEKCENADEVIISSGLVNVFLQKIFNDNVLYSEDEIKSGKLEDVLYKKIIGKEIDIVLTMSNTKIGTKKIVGIVDDEENMNIYFHESVADNMVYNKCTVYLDHLNKKSVNNLEKSIDQINLKYNKWSKGKGQSIISRISIIIVILTFFAMIVAIFSVIVIHFFMKISIYERKYEIGVLRTLGNTRKEICKLLLLEQIIIALITGITAIFIMVLLSVSGIMNMVRLDNVSIYQFNPLHMIYVMLYAIFIMVVFSIPDIYKASKRNIAELLKNSN